MPTIPIINVVCDRRSWADLLTMIPERNRFSLPEFYDQQLLDSHGRPLHVRVGDQDFHIYPPGRDS